MLKRLFIAVFVLGLVIGLNGTALCDNNLSTADVEAVQKVNPDNPRFSTVEKAGPDQPSFKKPEAALNARRLYGLQLPVLKQDLFCDMQDYTSGTLGYGWSIPDAYGDDLFNMRFTSDAGYDCTLKVAHFIMYGGLFGSGASGLTGDPDMMVYLWDDDGFGFPGNKLDSVLIPWADIEAAYLADGDVYQLSADFSAADWVFSDGAEYHIGWSTVQNSPDDTLAILSDVADGPYVGEERASEFYNGAWGTMLNDWGIDVSFHIYAERCCSEIPFTDCYFQAYAENIAYLWRAPHPVYGDEEYSMRFSVSGPETLQFIDVAIYDADDGTFGNDDVIIKIYDDDGGLPGNLLATETLPAGTYSAFPSYTTVVPSSTMIMDDDFHVSFSSTGAFGSDWESVLSSDGTDGTGRSASYYDTSGLGDFGWVSFLEGWGYDVNFLIEPYMCKDEFSDCSINWCNDGLAYIFRVPDGNPITGHAQRFTGVGEECKVKEVTWYMYWSSSASGLPLYSQPVDFNVYQDAAGRPGALLGSVTLQPADFAAAGLVDPGGGSSVLAPVTVDFEPLNIIFAGAYHVAVVPQTANPDEGIQVLSDDYTDPGVSGGCDDAWSVEFGGNWLSAVGGFGFASPDAALVVDAAHCCVPFSDNPCGTPTDWATYQLNQARTGASDVPVGDAWCDLTLNWHYEHPSNPVSFTGPTVYDDRVVCAFTTEYVVFDLQTGAQLYTFVPQTGPFPPGDVRCAPSIRVIPGYNGDNPVMFVSGGSNEETQAVDFNTGAVLWNRDLNTVGVGGLFGNTRWSIFTFLDVGGTLGCFWGTDDGLLVGVDATTGALLPNYPVALAQGMWTSLATDGTSLFIGVHATAATGDVYSIDPATGAINWSFASQFQANDVFTNNSWEGVSGGIAYDIQRDWIYFNSRADGDYPADGVFYIADAATGTRVGDGIPANRSIYSTPVVDAARVYMSTSPGWSPAPAGGDIYAVTKSSGVIAWVQSGGPYVFGSENAIGSALINSAVMSCEEPPVDDILFVFPARGGYVCIDAGTGERLFRRRVASSTVGLGQRGMGGALNVDATGASHLLFADTYGNLFDMTKQADRPRLEIQDYTPRSAVEFGAAPSLNITIPAIFTNTGCTDLEFQSVVADDVSANNQWRPEFSAKNVTDDMMDRSNSIADELLYGNEGTPKLTFRNDFNDNDVLSRDLDIERRNNYAAAGFPTFINGIVTPAVGDLLAPGDTMDLVIDVIQANILRGPQIFYLTLGTNDPDFFLNDPTLEPELQVTLVGGCLTDTTTLEFGIGGANFQWVSNNGRVADNRWSPDYGITIDGFGGDLWQSDFMFGVSQRRIALNMTSGSGNDEYISWQADPNWCDNQCKPFLDAGVTLGYITNDNGATYDPITGNLICASGVDSVQNFDDGGWDWSYFDAPFDPDSSMGLRIDSRTVGALDVPELASVTVQVFEFTERNGNTIEDFKFWNWSDVDANDADGVKDSMFIDLANSVAWGTNVTGAANAVGFIKIPFGCGYTGAKNVVTLDSDNSLYATDPGQYLDSAYLYSSRPAGEYSMPNAVSARDQSLHATLYEKDEILGNETFEFGIGVFLLSGLADPVPDVPGGSVPEIAELANNVNKWAGFGRGDVNNDLIINLADIVYLAGTVNGGPGAVPFQHLSDVNGDAAIDIADVDYLIDYYFNCGPCPAGEFIF